MPGRKIKLFISHASEDKESFARRLYEALKDEFDVWYDKARITLGDDIREKIAEGISQCDFGVVIYSGSQQINRGRRSAFPFSSMA